MRYCSNPGGNKYDETRYGTTANSSAGLSEPTTGTLSNPTGSTGQGLSGTTLSRLQDRDGDAASITAIKGGVMGSNSSTGGADSFNVGSEPSGLGQNPPTSTDRAFPLSGGQNATSSIDPSLASSSYADPTTAARTSGTPGLGSQLGRDAGIASGTGAERDNVSGPLSGLSLGNTSSSNASGVPGTQGLPHGSESHLGRDAGIVGAAGGASELASGSGRTSGLPTARDIPGDTFGYHNENETPVEGYVHHVPGPHATDIANRLDPHVPGEFPDASGEDRHLGRDATIGGTGLGATALGASALSRDHDQPASSSLNPNLSSSVGGSTGPAPMSVDSSLGQKDHHYGRDAGIAGVGAAGIGAGAYEASKLRDHDSAPGRSLDSTLGSAPSGYGSSAAPTSSSSVNPSQTTTNPEHHYGRDAGLAAAGVGAGGAGLYEANKLHDRDTVPSSSLGSSSTGAPGYGSSAAPSSSSSANPLSQTTANPEHHYGRDAGLAAAGVGAGGVGLYEANKLRDRDTVPSSSLGNNSTSSAPGYGSTSAAPTSSSGVAGLGSRDPLPATTDKDHHYSRDAALVGGTGAAGVGAAEAYKDRKDPEALLSSSKYQEPTHGSASSSKHQDPAHSSAYSQHETKAAPHDLKEKFLAGETDAEREHNLRVERMKHTNLGTIDDSRNRDGSLKSNAPQDAASKLHQDSPSTPSHTGRDAALVGGGAGVGAAGLYEAEKHHGNEGTQSSPYSSHETGSAAQDLSSKLHGGSSSTPSHAGRDTAAVGSGVGAAGLGTYEAEKRHGTEGTHGSAFNQHETALAPQALSSQLHEGSGSSFTPTHAGRDAALVGGVGAAGAGYEAEKHHGYQGTQEDLHQQGHNKLHKKEDPRDDPAYNAKHEHDLQTARAKEAKTGGDHGHAGEKKEGFLHKLLHHGDKDKSTTHEKETVAAAGVGGAALGGSALAGEAGSNTAAQHASEKYGHPMTYEKGVLAPAPGTGPTKDGVVTQPGTGETRRLPTESGSALPDFSHEHTGTGSGPGVDNTSSGLTCTGSNIGGASSGLAGTGTGSGLGGVGSGSSSSGIATEPHTGLPMNVGKYGTDGAGGTDGAQQISGLHQHGAAGEGSTTDWDKVKKLNTPY